MFIFKKFKEEERHVLITSDEPVRIEVLATNEGHLVVYGYKGTKIDEEQNPDHIFDSDVQ